MKFDIQGGDRMDRLVPGHEYIVIHVQNQTYTIPATDMSLTKISDRIDYHRGCFSVDAIGKGSVTINPAQIGSFYLHLATEADFAE